MARALLAAVLLGGLPAAVGACAGEGAEGLDGRFVISAPRSHGHFATDFPLVKKADAQITALLGHPVVFYLDASLVPRWEDNLEQASVAAIDGMGHELADLHTQQPTIFAWVAPRLRRVEWDYSAVDKFTKCTFDADSGTLRFVLTSDSGYEDDDQMVLHAMGRAYGQGLGGSFAAMDPSSVPSDQRKAYAEWLFEFAYGAENASVAPGSDDAVVDIARARRLLKVLRFADTPHPPDVSFDHDLHARIAEDAEFMTQVRREHPEVLGRLAANHPLFLAEAAVAAWMTKNLDALADADRRRFEEIIQNSVGREGDARTLPTFDVVGHYLHGLDQWVKSGKRLKARSDAESPRVDLDAQFLGVRDLGPDDNAQCGGPSLAPYLLAKSDPNQRKRLFDYAIGQNDPFVTKTVMNNLLGVGSMDAALAFWHATERDDAAFHASTRVLATYVAHCKSPESLYDQLPAMWKASPARHGLLAYLAFQFRTDNYLEGFARAFAPLTQDEFGKFLDEQRDALVDIHRSWRVLGTGWSRMDVLSPRLDRWLSDDRYKDVQSWADALGAIGVDMCTEGSTGDVRKLHDWIDRRVHAHPSELGVLTAQAQRSAGTCGPTPPKPPTRSGSTTNPEF
jgi:hypothetical protein